MGLLSKDAILGADDLQVEEVEVPEWGGTVRVKGLSGSQRDAYESSFVRLGPNGKPIGRNLRDARARLLVQCLVDENNERLFADTDAPALGARSGAVVSRLYEVAQRLSGLGKDAMEAAEGKSETPTSASTTG